MFSLLFRLLLLTLFALPLGLHAGPEPDRARSAADTAATAVPAASRHREENCISRLCAECDDTALNNPESSLRALIGRSFAERYYVGITAGKSWRPLENFGDRDNKVRVHNPKLGVAVRYSF